MNNSQFRYLVRKCRIAQKNFYKAERYSNTKKKYLIESKRLEKMIDEELERDVDNPSQKSLFD